MKKLLLALALVTAGVSWGGYGENAPNCKLVIHTKWKSGKKRVEVQEVLVTSRDECKLEARSRELTSRDAEDVETARVTFGFRAPTF